MSKNSNNLGRAYEFAWLNALHTELSKKRAVLIVQNSSYRANQKAWDSVTQQNRDTFQLSAASAIQTLIELEPLMEEDLGDALVLIPQQDSQGMLGDVRDILMQRNQIDWEIGLSIKHNHEAIKHGRLSHKRDFGNIWFGTPCSQQYWDAVKPVFDRLKVEQRKGTRFSQLEDINRDVYIPILNAFMDEVNRQYAADPRIARKMIEYLIGVHDYYKMVSHDTQKLTVIHTFNPYGTLNKPSRKRASVLTVPVLSLPTRIVALQRKPDSATTIEMYLDNGWQLSFRIHNAEKEVAPTLKFDIQFIGIPPEVLSLECRWNQL